MRYISRARLKDQKLASRRQSTDIRRDWRETSTPRTTKTCGRRSRPSQATEAEVPHHV